MKDKTKRILALLGAIVILISALLPMIFAFRKGENSQGEFMAVLAIAIFVPIFAFLCMMVYKALRGDRRDPHSRIKNVIFDVGNVLMLFDWPGYLKSFGFPEEKYERLSDVIFRSETWNQRDKGGRPEEEYVQEMVDACPEYEEDIREIMRRSYECIHPVEYSASWFQFLRTQGFRTYVLSNYCDYMLQKNRRDMDFLQWTDGEIFSCEVNQVKPGEEIYETLLSRYHLKPEECVFIDDREENCVTAESLGIQAIRFRNFPQAAKELEKLLSVR